MDSKHRQVVLLDLDGTLTRSHPGIIGSIVHAYHDLELEVPSDAELLRFIGPPIPVSLRRNHVPERFIDQFVTTYRSYYTSKAVFDDPLHPGSKVPGRFYNSVYDGIETQLDRLKNDGFVLALASCKPEVQATSICEHFGLSAYLDGVFGASTDASRTTKAQVVRYACESIGFDKNKDAALMVGDRSDDVDGSKESSIDCIGCRWGYAEPGELEEHGAIDVVDNVDELAGRVETYFAR